MKYVEIKRLSRKLRRRQTGYEKLLWAKLKDRQLEGYKFLRQHPLLYDRQGNDLNFFVPDFYCPKAKLVVEVDGSYHDNAKTYDQWREGNIRALGIKIIRFKNDEIGEMEKVLGKIRGMLPTPSLRCPPKPLPINREGLRDEPGTPPPYS